tara:strand:- start:239 stop:436 length:198 start_codon:yes stop_codon:yes gene_type:complete
MSTKEWESIEISLWVNNDEFLRNFARGCLTSNHFFEMLEDNGISEIGGITLTRENLRESYEDANE